MRIIDAIEHESIILGRVGERAAARVRFPVAPWVETYGNGSFSLLVQRPGDEEEPYAVTVSTSSGYVFWTVSNTDTALEGIGACELIYTVGSTVAKSMIFRTVVQPSLSEAGPAPAPWESWMDDIMAAAEQVENAILKVADADAGNLPKLKADGSIEDSDVPAADVLTKLDSATAGDLAALTADGDLQDSGIAAADVALQDGYYEGLTAGAAEALTGRGDGVPAGFTFRPTGGDADVADGTATIAALHGNTLFWNQLAPAAAPASNWAGYGGTLTAADDVISLTVTRATANPIAIAAQTAQSPRIFAGRKYFMTADMLLPRASASAGFWLGTSAGANRCITGAAVPANTWTTISGVAAADTDVSGARAIAVVAGGSEAGFQVDDVLQFRNVMVVDLTAMFGVGNEPATAEEFRLLFPRGYYTTQLVPAPIHYNGAGVQTIGFNQWNEDWEQGAISSASGDNISQSNPTYANYLRSKGFVDCFPGAKYYLTCAITGVTNALIFWYDANQNYLGRTNLNAASGSAISPADARYLRFCVDGANTYPGDGVITVNLSWSGYRDGEREAYWTQTREIPVSTYFPTGMKSAGAAYDELRSDKAIQRIGSVDAGSLTWGYSTTYTNPLFYATVSGAAGAAVLAGYTKAPGGYAYMPDKSFIYNEANSRLTIRDDAYSDAASFKAALTGVSVFYELATPVETAISQALNLSYRISDFGTERSLPDNEATPTTSPMSARIVYPLNVQDTVRRLPVNYISKSSFDRLAAELSDTLGVSITATYNAGTEIYDFTIADNRPLKIVSVPASATAAGTAGNIAIGGGYLYVCTASGEDGEAAWMRVQLSSWS